jgi:hypothetical protein
MVVASKRSKCLYCPMGSWSAHRDAWRFRADLKLSACRGQFRMCRAGWAERRRGVRGAALAGRIEDRILGLVRRGGAVHSRPPVIDLALVILPPVLRREQRSLLWSTVDRTALLVPPCEQRRSWLNDLRRNRQSLPGCAAVLSLRSSRPSAWPGRRRGRPGWTATSAHQRGVPVRIPLPGSNHGSTPNSPTGPPSTNDSCAPSPGGSSCAKPVEWGPSGAWGG